jgi:hypothetical protein
MLLHFPFRLPPFLGKNNPDQTLKIISSQFAVLVDVVATIWSQTLKKEGLGKNIMWGAFPCS